MKRRSRLLVLFDSPDEGWPSMELAGEMLVQSLRAQYAERLEVNTLAPRLPRLARRAPIIGARPVAFNVDRLAGRFVGYPLRVLPTRAAFDVFHVVDHTYASLVHALPARRTGVYLHDVDAFRSLLEPEREPRPRWFRLMARTQLLGLQRAARVFYSTATVRAEVERWKLVPSSRLVHAPLGAAPEFRPDAVEPSRPEVLARLRERPFLLHVGSGIRRKRLDVLFEVFARLATKHPALQLVQVGATLSPEHERRLAEAGVRGRVHLTRGLERAELAELYRRTTCVLLPSEAEGFGLPLLEALACGSRVLASELAVFREVAAGAAHYAPVGDVPAWVERLRALLARGDSQEEKTLRLARASRYSWSAHARIIHDAYAELLERDER